MPCNSPTKTYVKIQPTLSCCSQILENILEIDTVNEEEGKNDGASTENSVINTPTNCHHRHHLIPLITLPPSTMLQCSNIVKKMKHPIKLRSESFHSPTMPCTSPIAKEIRSQSFHSPIMPCNSPTAKEIRSQSFHSPTMPCTSPTKTYVKQPPLSCYSHTLENTLEIDANATYSSTQNFVDNTPRSSQNHHHLISLIALSHNIMSQRSNESLKTSSQIHSQSFHSPTARKIRSQSFHSPIMPCNSPTPTARTQYQS
jgi:hypothetical protein